MPVVYVSFSVKMHGLTISDAESLECLRKKVEYVVKDAHPKLLYDSDLEVTIDETAGEV